MNMKNLFHIYRKAYNWSWGSVENGNYAKDIMSDADKWSLKCFKIRNIEFFSSRQKKNRLKVGEIKLSPSVTPLIQE
jgi:hypothetical protein